MPTPKTAAQFKKALDELEVEYPKNAKLAKLTELWEEATKEPEEADELQETLDFTIQMLAGEINAILEWEPAIITDGDDDETMEAIMAGTTEEDCAALAIVSADMPIGPCPLAEGGEELLRFTPEAWDFMVENGILKHLGKNAQTIEQATKPKGAAAGKPAAGKTPKAPAAPKTPRFTRAMALAECAKSGETLDSIIKASSDLYIEKGGSDNVGEAKWLANMAFGVMTAMDLVTIEDGVLKVK